MPETIIPPTALEPLLARLTPEARQLVLEAPRGERLKILAQQLKIGEPDALIALESATGLDTATNLEANDDALGLLPARLVHDYQIVPIVYRRGTTSPTAKDDAGPLHLATAWPPDAVMMDWIRTFTS